jgi:hypothetical protein
MDRLATPADAGPGRIELRDPELTRDGLALLAT